MESVVEILDTSLFWQFAGAAAFVVYDATQWRWQHYVLWALFILAAMELLGRIILAVGRAAGMEGSDIAIRKQGKHLDELTTTDKLFIAFNKLCTALFTYHAIRFAWTSPDVRWKLTDATLVNTAVALVLLYVMYDLGYTLFHRLLHHRSLYGAIHKHHHRQMAPTRGNIDAINVHPFEFVTGEYNHLFVLWLVSRWLLRDFGGVHVITAVVFIVAGGVLASLNHTRFDVRLPVPLLSNYYWYQVRSHDVHHWYPPCNYGQYTMLWDKIMGSHRPYPTEDASAAGAVPLSGRWSSDQAKTA